MDLTQRDIEQGYWYYRPEEQFPPKSITFPNEYDGNQRLNVICTQTDSKLFRLRGLSLEGSMWTTQIVDSLNPLGQLTNLEFLSIANLKAKDKTLMPLLNLKKLKTLHLAKWWPKSEMSILKKEMPRLKV
jgi:hypothetical protein